MPHIHTEPGQIDLTVEVLVVHDARVLLRVHDKYGIWLSVGGHVELDEDPLEAARREVREEVGLEVTIYDGQFSSYRETDAGFVPLIPPAFLHRNEIEPGHHHVTLTYFATCEDDRVVPGGSDRSEVWRWFTRDELDDPEWGLKANVAAYARAAIDAISKA